MVRRVERIELYSHDHDALMEEFKKDVDEKRDAGWRLYEYSFFSEVNEFGVRYVMGKGFPYSSYATEETINKDGWILCSEKLPETDDYVLCWYEYTITEGTRIGEKNQAYGIGWYSQFMTRWNWDYVYGKGCKILAWVPLPKPYETNQNAV